MNESSVSSARKTNFRKVTLPPESPWRDVWGEVTDLTARVDLRRFWIALVLCVPVVDFCLYGANRFPAAGCAVLGLFFAAAVATVSRRTGRLVAGAAILVPSLMMTVVDAGFANFVSVMFGLAVLGYVNREVPVLPKAACVPLRFALSPLYFALYVMVAVGRTMQNVAPARVRRLVKWVLMLVPAVCISAAFLALLAASNSVVRHRLGLMITAVGEWLWSIELPSVVRVLVWVFAFGVGVMLLVPAVICVNDRKELVLFAKRKKVALAAKLKTQYMLVLAGVNVVFLFTNTLDAVYLWVRQAPPAEVSTTTYLYGGVYGLIFTTFLAGCLLAFFFNPNRVIEKPRAMYALGLCWVVQNVFLVAGIALRLWLHVRTYCLTPRRVEVAFFLCVVLAGFVLLAVYMRQRRSFKWLCACCMVAVAALFFVVQFVNINVMCARSAVKKRVAESGDLVIEKRFIHSVGISSWRVIKALAESEESPKARDKVLAEQCRYEFLTRANAKEDFSSGYTWRDYEMLRHGEARKMRERFGLDASIPASSIIAAWNKAVEITYAD